MSRPALCLLIVLVLVAGPVLADGFLTPLGSIAADQRTHLIRVTSITMIAVAPVLIGVPWLLWRYRRARKGPYRPHFELSVPLEFVMWGVPTLIIIVLGYWLWKATIQLDPSDPRGPDPLQVQVVGLDWKWLFLYPGEHVASVGALVIPVDKPVQLQLTTDTVMQSFMVSALAGQIYAMPGMVTRLGLRADRTGTATGENTQFNGEGFADQKVQVAALSPEDWQAWMEAARAGPVLDAQAYARLARRGTLADARKTLGIAAGPLRLRLDDDGLFEHIVQRYHQGRAVSAVQQPGAPGYRPRGERP